MKLIPPIVIAILLFGFTDIGYSQLKMPSLQKLKEITKKVQHRAKQSGRQTTLTSLKQITKQDFITGRHKKLVIAYEEGGKIKTMIAENKAPKLIMFGGSVFLFPHPIKELADFLKSNNLLPVLRIFILNCKK